MKIFLIGKGRWGYITGAEIQPSDPKVDGFDKAIAKWEMENAQILTWLHNSMEPSIGQNFSKYDTAKKVWDYLQGMYLELNFVKQYEFEMSIRGTFQKDKSI